MINTKEPRYCETIETLCKMRLPTYHQGGSRPQPRHYASPSSLPETSNQQHESRHKRIQHLMAHGPLISSDVTKSGNVSGNRLDLRNSTFVRDDVNMYANNCSPTRKDKPQTLAHHKLLFIDGDQATLNQKRVRLHKIP